MLRVLQNNGDASWLGAFAKDFRRRFLTLLSYQFREFPCIPSLSIMESASAGARLDESSAPSPLTKTELYTQLTPYDHKRLESYANNMLDYHVVLDLIPRLADLYFTGRIDVQLTGVQQAILLGIGLQRKDMDAILTELPLESSQLLAMFIKIVRKITVHFESLVLEATEAEMPQPKAIGVSQENAAGVHEDEVVDKTFVPLDKTLEEELEEEGDEALRELRAKQRELIDSLPLDQ